MNASISLIAMAPHTPFTPHIGGRISNSGIRYISWRVMLRKMEYDGLPMD